jgi:hypothetical protein
MVPVRADGIGLLHTFQGAPDGDGPESQLALGPAGMIYGTTVVGGDGGCNSPIGCGTIYGVVPSGSGNLDEILYSFKGGADGFQPYGGVIADAQGALYGTTTDGGDADCTFACGTVFRLSPVGGGLRYSKTVLYNFKGGVDGSAPMQSLVMDPRGILFGTTFEGGVSTCELGCGTVFMLTPVGATYNERIIYRFKGNTDGASPDSTLVMDSSGVLYGTTFAGGTGYGTVFELMPLRTGTYREKVIYDLSRASGFWPEAGLALDSKGALYGTTTSGGSARCRLDIYCGTVFKLAPVPHAGYSATILHDFSGGKRDGADSKAPVTAGGEFGAGTVFRLIPKGKTYEESVVHSFSGGPDGREPYAGLTMSASGALYGTTSAGGSCPVVGGCGTVFTILP